MTKKNPSRLDHANRADERMEMALDRLQWAKTLRDQGKWEDAYSFALNAMMTAWYAMSDIEDGGDVIQRIHGKPVMFDVVVQAKGIQEDLSHRARSGKDIPTRVPNPYREGDHVLIERGEVPAPRGTRVRFIIGAKKMRGKVEAGAYVQRILPRPDYATSGAWSAYDEPFVIKVTGTDFNKTLKALTKKVNAYVAGLKKNPEPPKYEGWTRKEMAAREKKRKADQRRGRDRREILSGIGEFVSGVAEAAILNPEDTRAPWEIPTWRVTRNKPYRKSPSMTPAGHTNIRIRQGHYQQADDIFDAVKAVAKDFAPSEAYEGYVAHNADTDDVVEFWNDAAAEGVKHPLPEAGWQCRRGKLNKKGVVRWTTDWVPCERMGKDPRRSMRRRKQPKTKEKGAALIRQYLRRS